MIFGIDEAGRGSLCGPVTAACVHIPEDITKNKHSTFDLTLLADSKTLDANARTHIALLIRNYCILGMGWAYPHEIDRLNIHHATLLAMQRSFYSCISHISPSANARAIVDGKFSPSLPITTEALIKGDTKIHEIKAASIIAKTVRDAHLLLLDRIFPEYGMAQHKGYPTLQHQSALNTHGASLIHRKSFRLSYKK